MRPSRQRQLEIDGSTHVFRHCLGDMLNDILGRPPRKLELDAWFTYCDYDRGCVMHIDEFRASIDRLVAFSANPESNKQYTSSDLYRTHHMRNRRVEYSPQMSLNGPATTAQEVGWGTIKPTPPQKRYALNTTDVTRREGRTSASYFGMYLS